MFHMKETPSGWTVKKYPSFIKFIRVVSIDGIALIYWKIKMSAVRFKPA